MGKYRLTHTGPQVDAGLDAALNPDTVPEADSDALITSDAVAKVQQGFAPIETAATAANAYAVGDLLVWGGVLYKAKTAITVGDSFTVGTNIETTTVADKLNNIDTEITTDTDTTISGLLKGSSGKVAPAVGDTDYATPAAMTATRQMLAPILADPAGQAVSAGDYFIYNGTLYKALQAITSAMTAATFTGATYSEAVSNGGLNALKSALPIIEKTTTVRLGFLLTTVNANYFGCVNFPFLTKDDQYSVSVSNVYMVGIGASSRVFTASNKSASGCSLTNPNASTSYPTVWTIADVTISWS